MSFPNRSPQTRNNGKLLQKIPNSPKTILIKPRILFSLNYKKGSWFHLAVDGGTLLKIPPVNQTVLEYEAAFFHCSVKNPETMFVTWFKDGNLLSSYNDLTSRTKVGTDGSLLITPTLMNDLGIYECRIKNELGEEETAHAYLNVQCKFYLFYE